MVPDDCGATTGASGADRPHSYSASICLLVARVCFAGKQEHSEAMRPIAKCYRRGLAGRRCCLNIATDPIAASVVLGRGWFAWASTRVAKRVRCLRIFKWAWMVVPSVATSSLPCTFQFNRKALEGRLHPKVQHRPHSACGRRRGPFIRPGNAAGAVRQHHVLR
jgi:hypothetical protein